MFIKLEFNRKRVNIQDVFYAFDSYRNADENNLLISMGPTVDPDYGRLYELKLVQMYANRFTFVTYVTFDARIYLGFLDGKTGDEDDDEFALSANYVYVKFIEIQTDMVAYETEVTVAFKFNYGDDVTKPSHSALDHSTEMDADGNKISELVRLFLYRYFNTSTSRNEKRQYVLYDAPNIVYNYVSKLQALPIIAESPTDEELDAYFIARKEANDFLLKSISAFMEAELNDKGEEV